MSSAPCKKKKSYLFVLGFQEKKFEIGFWIEQTIWQEIKKHIFYMLHVQLTDIFTIVNMKYMQLFEQNDFKTSEDKHED